jgi:rSAM/selenodomain-associated transferase 2
MSVPDMSEVPRISVIIPALNEEQGIRRTLGSVLAEGVEVIVVDGGSSDATCAVAGEMGAVVLHSSAGRGVQMNMGAEYAGGEVLLFVHADTELPDQYVRLVEDCLAGADVVAGAFRLHLAGAGKGLAVIAWGANIRSKWLGLIYGDQGLFMPKEIFSAVGGYPETAIMEDFMMVRQLRKKGRIRLAPGTVKSSGRRWEKHGLWRPFLVNQLIMAGYFLGIPLSFLAKLYGVRKG